MQRENTYTVEKILENLAKPLAVEGKTGYRDQSVIGGFAKYIQDWAGRGAETVEPPEKYQFEAIGALFSDYCNINVPERQARVQQAQQLIAELTNRISIEIEKPAQPEIKGHRPAATGRHSFALETPVQFLKGIGPRRAELLSKIGVETTYDLITHFPRRYDDRSEIGTIAELVTGERQSVFVTVIGQPHTEQRRRVKVTKVPVGDETGTAFLIYFNQPYMKNNFFPNMKIYVHGKVEEFRGQISFNAPDVESAASDETLQTGRIVPSYPLTEGLQQNFLRGLIHCILPPALSLIAESFPDDLMRLHSFMPLHQALQQIHFPDDLNKLGEATRRLIFEEFLLMQLALALRGRGFKDRNGIEFNISDHAMKKFVGNFPFKLTGSQTTALKEIHDDMAKATPMNRLLHGEVGSGKTVIGATAMYTAVLNDCQAAFMAPTEILAEQHYHVLKELFAPFDVNVALIIGGQAAREKKVAREKIADGTTEIAVGTHALIEAKTEFKNLGLIVVDEQHRFGVMQRKTLIGKARENATPDVLVMTATPIPRTLALTVYGDLDVSVLRELPPGRKPVDTKWLKENRKTNTYKFVREQLEAGMQAYVVCPLIEESDVLDDLNAVLKHAEWLKQEALADYRVGVLHGRLPSHEKDKVMTAFRRGEIHVLCTTTVIEVGVDVPNASIIVIEDAHRFGLAQLHQLRGRVGRSNHKSYCRLIGSASTEDGRQRLKVMEKTNDGFQIAEEDLNLRGPGEFYGTRQHGLPDLRIANILRDTNLLSEARKAAQVIVENDPKLSQPRHVPLRAKILQFFKGHIELLDVS